MTREVKGLHRDPADVDTVPLPDRKEPIGHMSGLNRLFVDWGTQLRSRGGEASTTRPNLTAANRANDAHATVRSVDPRLNRSGESLVAKLLFDGEWVKGEGAPRRFCEEGRNINGKERRQRCRRFTLHELRL
jgi:hypothetical protein